MVVILITTVLSLFVTALFGHVVHWALHQKWSGAVNDAHMAHHLRLYPPSDFTSKVYRNAGQHSTPKFFAIAAIPLVLIPILLWAFGIVSLSVMVTALTVEGLMGFLHNYLHDAFHIEDHWLYRVPIIGKWFRELVKLHYLHHIDMGCNFGIFSFFWDKVFGTYRNDK